MTDDGDKGFLSRWSQRKAQSRAADVVPEVAPEVRSDATQPPTPVAPVAAEKVPDATEPSGASRPAAAETAVPPPTLDDVERLTPDADFSPFVDRLVQPDVRNAAMKKLFADPHFNVMDGLDVYIDDYNKTEPMPRQWLRQLVQARVLGLLDDEVEEQPRPDTGVGESPSRGGVDAEDVHDAAGVDDSHGSALAMAAPDTLDLHEDADLPLQPDDAAGHGGARAAADDDADGAG